MFYIESITPVECFLTFDFGREPSLGERQVMAYYRLFLGYEIHRDGGRDCPVMLTKGNWITWGFMPEPYYSYERFGGVLQTWEPSDNDAEKYEFLRARVPKHYDLELPATLALFQQVSGECEAGLIPVLKEGFGSHYMTEAARRELQNR